MLLKTIAAFAATALAAYAGVIQITSLDVEADRAVSVTGVQSNRIEELYGRAFLPDRAAPDSFFITSENGTGSVWRIRDRITISEDFGLGSSQLGAIWTTNVFPFVFDTEGEGIYTGYYTNGLARVELSFLGDPIIYASWASTSGTFPQTLVPEAGQEFTSGTATIDKGIYINLFATFATAAERAAIEAQIAELQQSVAAVESNVLTIPQVIVGVNPAAIARYGDNATTNETGYGAFLTANPATQTSRSVSSPTAGQVIAAYQWRVPYGRVGGAASLSHTLVVGGIFQTSAVETVVETYSASATLLSSNRVSFVQTASGGQTKNIVSAFALPSVASGGVVRVTIRETIANSRTLQSLTGGATPMTLAMTHVPLDYATPQEVSASVAPKLDRVSGVATNLTAAGDTFTLLGLPWSWSADLQTYNVVFPQGENGQLFQELFVHARNQTGAHIDEGRVVCITDPVGDNVAIRLASSDDPTCKHRMLGVVTRPGGIPHGESGKIGTFGDVNDLPLAPFESNTDTWLHTNGLMTAIEPDINAVAVKAHIGTVLRSHPSEGRLRLQIQWVPTAADVGAPTHQQMTNAIGDAIAALPPTNFTAWTGTVVPANGTATVTVAHGALPVLVLSAPAVLQIDPAGYGTAGVSRVSLSYYVGANALTFATNVVAYAATPTVATNAWNSLLLRRVSDGAWKGVGL